MDIDERKHQVRLRRFALVQNIMNENSTTQRQARLQTPFASPKRSESERGKRPMSHDNVSPHQKGLWANEKSRIGLKMIHTTKKEWRQT
jgi:hypothetical protein